VNGTEHVAFYELSNIEKLYAYKTGVVRLYYNRWMVTRSLRYKTLYKFNMALARAYILKNNMESSFSVNAIVCIFVLYCYNNYLNLVYLDYERRDHILCV